MPKAQFQKVRHDKNFELSYEGEKWTLDVAEWLNRKTGKGELRVYRIEGNITSPLLNDALELEAMSRGLAMLVSLPPLFGVENASIS